MTPFQEHVRQWLEQVSDNTFTVDEASTQFTVDLARDLSAAIARSVLRAEASALSEAEVMAAAPQAMAFALLGLLRCGSGSPGRDDIKRVTDIMAVLMIQHDGSARPANGDTAPGRHDHDPAE